MLFLSNCWHLLLITTFATMSKQLKNIQIKNRKASFEYFLMDEFTAGIQLTGSEIKSIRYGKASIAEAYCYIKDGELFIKNMHISEYNAGGYANHDPVRERKLLLTKRELKRIESKTVEKGLTIIPILLFISESGYAKLNIAIAKGKKFYDKRDTIKAKDIERDTKRRL